MNKLKITTLNFTAELTRNALLPSYLGNTIRGAMGHALDDMQSGAYDEVFKVADDMQNPYVVKVPQKFSRDFEAEEQLEFSLLLFGSATDWTNDIREAVKMGCERSFAGYDSILRIINTDIDSDEWSDEIDTDIPNVKALDIEFITPARIMKNKNLVSTIEFPDFIEALFNRISAIIDFYGESEFSIQYNLVNRKPYIQAVSEIATATIKQEDISLEGVLGATKYYGELRRYLPYIALGTKLHFGKHTTRGCGEYIVEIGGI